MAGVPAKPRILLVAVASYAGVDYRPVMTDICANLASQGYDPKGLTLENDAKSDALVKETLAQEVFVLVLVGGGIRMVPGWDERIVAILKDSPNSGAILVKPNVPSEAIPLIKEKLPLS